MNNQHRNMRGLWQRVPSIGLHRPANFAGAHGAERSLFSSSSHFLQLFAARHRRSIERVGIVVAVLGGLMIFGLVALWWRLASGPIQVNMVTPWLAAAIEDNFGGRRHVEIGGTQIERTENGGTAVRIRDIVVRDADGTVVASAPKAEVHVSGLSLLKGQLRAESLNLVGAETAIRIEQNGGITIFAGADKHPIVTASAPLPDYNFAPLGSAKDKQAKSEPSARIEAPPGTAPVTPPAAESPATSQRRASNLLAALLAWIDGIGQNGLDGNALREIGLKNGNLTVDDERTGKTWNFHGISLSIERPRGGGIEVTVGSDNRAQPWALSASVRPIRKGFRKIELEARRVVANDLLLASRLGGGKLETDVPLSAKISGEIGPSGVPQSLSGRVIAEAGSISDGDENDGRLTIDGAEFRFNWDAVSRLLTVPFQIRSGGDRITLMGQVRIPQEAGVAWPFKIGGGTILLTTPGAASDPLILNHIALSGSYDTAMHRIVVDAGDIGNAELGIAISGNLDSHGDDARLRLGVAGTRMPVGVFKRLWPAFVSPKVRDWFNERLISGTVERMVIAVNSPLEALKAGGPPIPDDGLTLDARATGCVIRPVDGLPVLRDADLNVHIVGRNAVVALGRAIAELPSGRKLIMTTGAFEVPDTAPHEPPARVHFKLEGPVPAAIELLHTDRLRDVSNAPFDPSTVRGNMTAQVTLGMPVKPELTMGSTTYSVAVEATNFAAEHMIMGQRVEAAVLRASASQQGYQLKGDVKIGATPATLEYRKLRDEPEAELRLQATLDEAARAKLGLDVGNEISGTIPIRLTGRLDPTSEHEGRFNVEADLTPAQIDGFLPGWVKSSGKPARATFTLIAKQQAIHIDNLLIEGAGGGVKGTIEFDSSGELQAATFPAYGFSDGDRATLRAERASDGAMHVVMRGDVYDGRGFIKGLAGVGSSSEPAKKRRITDVDLDVKLGAVVGFNGEALRSLDLKMSRRAGEIRSFGLSAKIGHDATLSGDLRGQPGGRQVVYLRTSDAGAFFRFTDVYARVIGGQMSIAMDPPSVATPAQQGVLHVRDFAVRDEAQLERAVSSDKQASHNAIDFSAMKVDFIRTPGRVALRDGVVRGPLLGGTIDGVVDYAHGEVHMRGTLVPLYGPNNLLGQLPLFGLFFGGEKEGLVGITYEVVGRPGTPLLRINPISALAPGLLRKVFEFPAGGDREGEVGSTPGAGNSP